VIFGEVLGFAADRAKESCDADQLRAASSESKDSVCQRHAAKVTDATEERDSSRLYFLNINVDAE
jgi:hypothetical protein